MITYLLMELHNRADTIIENRGVVQYRIFSEYF